MDGDRKCVEECDIIYLNFSKAVDNVPHHRLIGKMAATGVKGRVTGRIQQWLEGRMQIVVINGRYSDWTDVSNGVP